MTLAPVAVFLKRLSIYKESICKSCEMIAEREPLQDVAFTDGGMDGEDSSDDDMPLAQRAMKVTS